MGNIKSAESAQLVIQFPLRTATGALLQPLFLSFFG